MESRRRQDLSQNLNSEPRHRCGPPHLKKTPAAKKWNLKSVSSWDFVQEKGYRCIWLNRWVSARETQLFASTYFVLLPLEERGIANPYTPAKYARSLPSPARVDVMP
ncbi:hypothetical protein L218DRAFT_947460 [Marasmius fiardii PR-910]|nr:hypothetical protein L218DRAFT_947460 [Marasmius fiardii PR-910]